MSILICGTLNHLEVCFPEEQDLVVVVFVFSSSPSSLKLCVCSLAEWFVVMELVKM